MPPAADYLPVSEATIDPRGVSLLLIDGDSERRAALAASLAEAGYGTILQSVQTEHLSAFAAGRVPDLVIVDLDAPGMSTALLNQIRGALSAPPPAIIGLTSDASPAGRARAATLGVQDVGLRPIIGDELRLRVNNALAGTRLRRLLTDRSARLSDALRGRAADLDTVRESLSALAAMADYHDDDSDRHAQRVGVISAAIAELLQLPPPSVTLLRAAAPLHDVGKVGISRRILLKPGKLTESEWLHMQHHVEIGAQILVSSRSPVLMLAAEISRTHHERFDGSGYAAGLRGEEIPLSGRIVAVADVWDTLTHDRPYRPAWRTERALEEILSGAGTHFDPRVVEAFATLDHDTLAAPPSGTERRAA